MTAPIGNQQMRLMQMSGEGRQRKRERERRASVNVWTATLSLILGTSVKEMAVLDEEKRVNWKFTVAHPLMLCQDIRV